MCAFFSYIMHINCPVFLRKLQFQHPKMNACVDDNVLQEGRIYTRGGKLAASVVQEGLIRYHAA